MARSTRARTKPKRTAAKPRPAAKAVRAKSAKTGKTGKAGKATTAAKSGARRYVYAFGGGRADGRADMKDLLGG
jgi:pyruvate,orthophosphate dikinase